MKSIHRFLALLLSVVLLFTTVPLALADGDYIVDNGSCGYELTWSLNSTGILTIDGTGQMYNYSKTFTTSGAFSSAPWGIYRNRIKKVIVNSGVTSIGWYAFYGCPVLEEVVLSEGVTSIDYYAFRDCIALKSITIPSSLKSVGDRAFFDCNALEKVHISNIDAWASIAFYDPTANPAFRENTILLLNNKPVTNLVLSEQSSTVGNFAFYNCTTLQSITIPSSVKYIGKEAFYNCNRLYDLDIENGVKTIEEDAFMSCESLENVTLPISVSVIGQNAFAYCFNLASITVLCGKCEIVDSEYSINSATTIYGYEESPVQSYATKYNRMFISLGEYIHEHTPVVHEELGNCQKKGFRSTTCSVCCEELGYETTGYGDHVFVENYSEGNCVKGRTVYYTCEICGTGKTEKLAATDHIFGESKQKEFCNGLLETFTCTCCGYSYDNVVIEPNHDYVETSRVEPTCVGEGTIKYHCNICGSTKTESLPATGHSFGEWKITQEPCVADGKKERVCSSCGKIETEYIPATGEHNWSEWKTIKEPCVVDGKEERVCSICGKKETKSIPASRESHDWGEVITDAGDEATNSFFGLRNPTCSKTGRGIRFCNICNKYDIVYEIVTVPTLEHQFGEWTVARKPSCINEGSKKRVCENCGFTEYGSVPAERTEHDWEDWTVGREPDCVSNGYKYRFCKICEHNKWSYEEQSIPATGHTFGAWSRFVMASDAAVAVEIRFCNTCGYYELRQADPANPTDPTEPTSPTEPTAPTDPTNPPDPGIHNHVYNDSPDIAAVAPTCTTDGHGKGWTCTVPGCGAVKWEAGNFKALGHQEVVIPAVEATCTEDGSTEGIKCSRCGTILVAPTTIKIDHVDDNNDGKCDTCGAQMTGGDHCKYCGKIHDGAFGWLTKFFHSILAIFKR